MEKKSEVNRPDIPVVKETMPNIITAESHSGSCACKYCKAKASFLG